MKFSVHYTPKTLLDICLEYVALNFDDILDGEKDTSHRLPTAVRHLISDKVFEVCQIHDDNFAKILNQQTRNILLKDNNCKIQNRTGFFMHLQEHCKNVVKIDLSDFGYRLSFVDMKLIGEAFGSMVHLEWIKLDWCDITDQCLQSIGLKCHKLKYLNLENCQSISDAGLRALCDPSVAPYGNCTQLTEIYLEGCGSVSPNVVTPNGMSLLLLHCPNLEILDAKLNLLALVVAILELNGVDSGDWNTEGEFDQQEQEQLVFQRAAALTWDSATEHPTFMLKSLDFVWFFHSKTDLNENLSKMIGMYCPFLEILDFPWPVAQTFSLSGFLRLPLRSLSIDNGHFGHNLPAHMIIELIQLLRSVGNTLRELKLRCQVLYVIYQECPNLTMLSLAFCGPPKQSANLPSFPISDLGSATFESLTELYVRKCKLSCESFVSLLSSPNLEIVNLHDGFPCNDKYIILGAVQQTLLQCPEAFLKLREVSFSEMRLEKETLNDLLERAVVLVSLSVSMCFTVENGQRVYYDTGDIKQLIRVNNGSSTSVSHV